MSNVEIPEIWPSLIIDGEGDEWWLHSLTGLYASQWCPPTSFVEIVERWGITLAE